MDRVSTKQGYLFLVGGAEDRKGNKRVLKYIVDKLNPANITIIPTASSYPRDIDRCYTDAFGYLDVPEIRCLDIRYAHEADRGEYLEAIDRADLIYFGGGDQAKLVDTLKQTILFGRIKSRFESGMLHIAGTSAGASAIGNPIFYHGNRKGLKKGSIDISEGFGFLDGIAIDTHFTARRRFSRLCQFLISGECTRGIGIDEDTGIMVYPNHQFEVFGSRGVTVVNSANVTGSNYAAILNGEHLRFNNMRVGVLPVGTRFSIKKWSVLTQERQKYQTKKTKLI